MKYEKGQRAFVHASLFYAEFFRYWLNVPLIIANNT